MKIRTLVRLTALVLAAAAAVGCMAGARPIPASPADLGLEPIEFEIPEVESWQLENGITVYYRHNDELPQVHGTLYFPGGALTEPWQIAGLASATGSQMREGSTAGISPNELDKKLDNLAASIETAFGDEYGSASFFCLDEDFDQVFSLYADIIRRPAFNGERLELWKRLSTERIRRRRDDPGTMASMAFRELLFGIDTPFTKAASIESLSQITPAKMKDFHRLFVRPDGAIFAVSGSVPREKIEAAIREKFGDWRAPAEPRPELPTLPARAEPGVYVLEREFSQATILIGHRGPPRHTPDSYEMKTFNTVFGHGSFGSVLFREIRSNLGLAYSVYGGLWPGVVSGVFQIDLATRAPEALRAIEKALELTRRSIQELPNYTDFKNAKSADERSFVFKFADPSYLAQRAATLQLLKYPSDYDETYLEKMEAVTPEMVREVGKRWIDPADMIIVIVGQVSAEELRRQLEGRLPVHTFEFDTKPRFGEVHWIETGERRARSGLNS